MCRLAEALAGNLEFGGSLTEVEIQRRSARTSAGVELRSGPRPRTRSIASRTTTVVRSGLYAWSEFVGRRIGQAPGSASSAS
jgi:hypothetical protein